MTGTFLWLAAMLLTAAVNVTIESPAATIVSGMLLLALFPGALLTRLIISPEELDFTSRLLLGFCLSLLLNSLGYMLLCYALEEVTTWMVIALVIFYGVFFIVLYQIKRPVPGAVVRLHSRWNAFALLILVLAALLRFTHLGYSDFQADEAGNCMYNSVQLVKGNHSVILRPVATSHRRPPVQILVPAVSYHLTRTFDEGVSRFPFALAGLATVWFIYVLGREIFKQPLAGCVAGFLAALNGYFLAYSRTVQYQSVVTLSMALCVLFLWRFMKAENPLGMRKYLVLGMVFFAFTVLTHFEGFIFFPVLLYALAYKHFRIRWVEYRKLLAGASLLFFGLMALYYGPFFLLETSTGSALAKHWGERHDASLHFHWDLFFSAIPFYLSKIYLLALIALAPLAIFGKNRDALGMIACWFLPFFLYYVVLSSLPNTHVYTFFPALLLLAGRGFQNLFDGAARLPVNRAAFGRVIVYALPVILVFIGVFTGTHHYTLFINHNPEYAWSRQRSELPINGIYGFPYQRGWKTVGALFRNGELEGRYHSNEKRKITLFYLRQNSVKKPKAQFLLKTKDPQSWRKEYVIPQDYGLKARIIFRGRPSILIYEKGKAPGKVKDYDAGALENVYAALDRVAP